MWRNSTLQTLGFGNLLAFDSVHKWTHLHCRIHVEEQWLHETHLRHLASRDDALRTSPKDGACEYLNIKSSNWIYIAHGQQKVEATHQAHLFLSQLGVTALYCWGTTRDELQQFIQIGGLWLSVDEELWTCPESLCVGNKWKQQNFNNYPITHTCSSTTAYHRQMVGFQWIS